MCLVGNIRLKSLSMEGKHDVMKNESSELELWLFKVAEAIRTTVVPISGVIRTTVVPISGVIGPTVVRIANATGIGYRHDGSIRFSYKLTNVLNY